MRLALVLICVISSIGDSADETTRLRRLREVLEKEFLVPSKNFPFTEVPAPSFGECQHSLTTVFLWSLMEEEGKDLTFQDPSSVEENLELECVNAPETEAELAGFRRSVARGNPFGHEK